jgi:hypothetical protein
MNPGPVEEAGKVAHGIVDALKAQPAVLALTIANMALLLFIFYALHGAAKYRETLMQQVLDNSKNLSELIQRGCAPRQGG